MGVSKVTLNGTTLIDVTDKTVDTDNLIAGNTALRNDGESITGAVVTAPASTSNPIIDGTASPGVSDTYSRGDHVHPTDTSRAPIASPAFTGTPTVPNISAQSSNGQIANKKYVDDTLGSLGTVLDFKGTKTTASQLPSTGNTTGDVWIVTDTSSEYVWTGTAWEQFGTSIDLSGYVQTSRTINNKALTSDITLTASDVGALPDNTVIPQGTVTSVRVQATSPVQSSTSTAQSTSLNTTISLANGYGDTKNPYSAKTANTVLAGPSSGTDAAPTFRALVADDIPSITKSKISDFPTSMTPTSHTHGDITNSGDITNTATIASGDRLVINDESASKITNSSITFGTSETTYLTNKGTWATPTGTYSLPTASADELGGIKVGTNLSISNGVLSATDTTYTAGTGIDITNGVISNTQTSAEWGNITGTLSDQTDLNTALGNKQDTLTFDGTYNASTNKAATVSTVTNAINALDGGTIGTGSTTKTITSLSQTNGNVSATFSDIAFPVTSVNTKTGAVSLTASDVGAQSTISVSGILKGGGSGNISAAVAGTDYQAPLPSQSGNSGKFLTTNGSALSWGEVDALPSQTGQSGKFLTTDGTDASWAEIPPTVFSRYIGTITGDGSTTSFTITHNLNSRDVIVDIYDSTTYESVLTDVVRTNANTITVSFATAPAASTTYTVIVLLTTYTNNSITIDTGLNGTSTNPVTNQAIYNAVSKAVSVESQTFTNTEKEQARANIGAGGSNPNLLDNPWFTSGGLINQRGISTSTVTSNTYLIDRWYSSRGVFSVTDDGLSMYMNVSPNSVLCQYTGRTDFTGKVMTISVKVNGNIYSKTGVASTTEDIWQTDYVEESVQFRLHYASAVNCYQFLIYNYSSTPVVFQAVKLEFGSVSTLVNDVAPNYVEELAKCQRYFLRITGNTTYNPIGSGFVSTAYWLVALIPTPVTLRVAPTVSFSGTALIRIAGSTQQVNSAAIVGLQTNGAVLQFNSSAMTPNETGVVTLGQGSYIDLSADLMWS